MTDALQLAALAGFACILGSALGVLLAIVETFTNPKE